MKTATILCALLLAGCASTPAPGPVTSVCLPLGNITPDQEKAAGAALQTNPDPNLLAIVSDWEHMRAADQACIAKQGPTP